MKGFGRPHKRYEYHGLSTHPLYRVWSQMIQRCTNPSDQKYKDYGARGITVCERWSVSFLNFLSDMGARPDGMTLDRFPNNDGNYEPSNCRWATPREQGLNKRMYRANKTGITGVYWREDQRLFHAMIKEGGRNRSYFSKVLLDACAWRKSRENERAKA